MAELSPMMKQYFEIKEKNKDSILFFRLGDFYEMFYDDAKLASKELELTLTGRDCGQDERAPMCGIPYHSCDGYIARLIQKGYKVAICEQTEDPALAKGIVRREVVRIITPGTVIDSKMLDGNENNFISSVYTNGNKAGVCFVDLSTVEIYATQLENDVSDKIKNEVGRFVPKEILYNKELIKDKKTKRFFTEKLCSSVTELEDGYYEESINLDFVKEQLKSDFNRIDLDIWGYALKALGVLLRYLSETQKTALPHLVNLSLYGQSQYLDMDLFTRRNLEITETIRQKEKTGSLLWILDKTKTAMGSRMLKNWLEQPLVDCAQITKRKNAVGELIKSHINRMEITELLNNVYDIERLMTKIVYQTANARDLKALSHTFKYLPDIKERLSSFETLMLTEIEKFIDPLKDIYNLIEFSVNDDPPFNIKEGGIIKKGYSEELDSLHDILKNGHQWISSMEAAEREKTGITKLKIGFNKVFGYYIEVTKSQYDLVPQTYIRKQTLANCERFITEELKEMENKILSANDKITSLEYELFCEIRTKVAAALHRIQKTARHLAKLDVLCSFAEVAAKNNYSEPIVDNSGIIDIKDGRHPVVEKMLKDSLFVPNDTLLDTGENRFSIITGPNMAGKSTYMRQVALIVLMAQTGSYVPAKSAKIGVVDKIFTRVGASDDLSAGLSTFMVEMSEVSNILRNATSKSLLIFDEIGRGTSTFDGMSIAKAVAEYVSDKKKIGAKALFATHYHELKELENEIDGVKNYNVAVKKRGDDITFLRKIVRGGTDDSYGIEVAKLAGLPNEVIKRAKDILLGLEELELKKRSENKEIKSQGFVLREDFGQLSLEDNSASEIMDKLKEIDFNILTPIEAMNILFELKQKAVKG